MKFYQYILLICFSFLSVVKAEERADSTLMRWLRSDGLVEYQAESASIYSHGSDKFVALLSDLRNAKKTIDVEYFIFANDSVAHLVIDELKAAAKRGVKVRLIVDGYKDYVKGYGYDGPRKDSLTNVGVETRIFDAWRFPHILHVPRDHRKIAVIDGEIGYVGGFNVSDYYVIGRPEFGAWRDTHIRIKGDAAKGLTWLFEKSWKTIELSKYSGEIEHNVPDSIRRPSQVKSQDGKRTFPVVYFERSRENKKKKTETRRALVEVFNSAKDTIKIVTPYFLPTHTVRVAIDKALERGVVIQLLVSKAGDELIFNSTNMDVCKRYIKRGMEVYLYDGAFHHSKILMVDNQYCMVGSANMNSRSMKWDYEASCFVFDKDVTADLTRIFEDDKHHSEPMSLQYYRELPAKTRILGWISHTFFTLFI